MDTVEQELDRVLMLLRNKIREQGFTQLQVQEQLQWGRSYISQLLTKQKSLRVEQVLRILEVIGVEASDFYHELYRFPRGDAGSAKGERYSDPRSDLGSYGSMVAEVPLGSSEGFEELRFDLRSSRLSLQGLIEVLAEKGILTQEELDALRSELMPSRPESTTH
ncbi:MAG: helix-turn-helix transcriptional regulator [Planctomycetota bacterium]